MKEIKYRKSVGSFGFSVKKEEGTGKNKKVIRTSYKIKPDGVYINGVKQETNEVPDDVAKAIVEGCGTMKLRVLDSQDKPVLLDANGNEFELGGGEVIIVDPKAKSDTSGKDDTIAKLEKQLGEAGEAFEKKKAEIKELKDALKAEKDQLAALQADHAALVAKTKE